MFHHYLFVCFYKGPMEDNLSANGFLSITKEIELN